MGTFLDHVEARLGESAAAGARQKAQLPGHAQELREKIQATADEAATRVSVNCADPTFRQRVVTTFSDPFEVEMLLDPAGKRLDRECHRSPPSPASW